AFDVFVRPQIPPSSVVLATTDSLAPGHGAIAGPPDDATLTRLGVPAIDEGGTLAFLGKWDSPTSGKGSGLFTGDHCVGVVTGQVPNAGMATYKSFSDPVIDGGRVGSIITM